MSGLDLTYLIELGWLMLQVFIIIIPLSFYAFVKI